MQAILARLAVLLWVASFIAPSGVMARSLTIEDRVAAQKAIEQVYWKHRVWPAENPGAKPPLDEVLSDEAIRAKVRRYLQASDALATFWNRPIEAEHLQAEIDRMAANSKDPALLRELFAALNDDPVLAAETLARPNVADRRIREAYAADVRIHGDLLRGAQAATEACRVPACMASMTGTHAVTTFELGDARPESLSSGAVPLAQEEWDAMLGRLARAVGGEPQSLETHRLGRIEESADQITVTAVLEQRAGTVTVGTTRWEKKPFETWWSEQRTVFSTDIDAAEGPFQIPALADSACVDDTWTPTKLDAPDPRSGATVVWTGSEVIVWGGLSSEYFNSGGRYNPATDSWQPTSTGAGVPTARWWQTAVWTGTEMIVWGGYGGEVYNTGGRYNPSTDSWTATSTGTNVPIARERHTAVWTGTLMVVWGGNTGTLQNTGGRYNPSTNAWTTTSTGANVPAGRIYHTAVWSGTQMLVWGGWTGAGGIVNNGGRYNPSTNAWATLSTGTNVPEARSAHSAVWTGSVMVVWGGGVASGNTSTGGRYNPATNAWTTTSTGANVPAARGNHGAVWTGSEMVVWGGTTSSTALDTGGRYNPTSDSWTPTSTGANLPRPSTPAVVWTGSEVFVWGGGGLGANARYNPSSDSWVPVSMGTMPAARTSHSAVWTGTEMIVWGGAAPTETNTGGRYTPATDSWIPTSTGAGVPGPRLRPRAVWTGERMVVWGGQSGSIALDTGGVYDPSADTWSETALGAGLPSARLGAAAVWTGTEMIVWGGQVGGAPVNTGGRYRPSTDSWAATSVGAETPSARSGHSLVWTGSRMVVWGGHASGSPLATGARYDPVGDAWTATSTAPGTPTARSNHTSVWTGARMLVWGGIDPTSVWTSTNTGASYDPASDTWTPTAPGPNALGAYDHSAFWTGSEMLVWGGSSFVGASPSGGRYDPVADSWLTTSTGPNLPGGVSNNSAVWTGTRMIVWGGGSPTTATGALYCACTSFVTVYRDADGDGFGDAGATATTCAGSLDEGYADNDGDCDDADPGVFPGAGESCNGADDDCDSVVDDGADAPCDDADPCTDDTCGGVAGCAYVLNAAPCDDGDACTVADVCQSGACAGSTVGAPSETGNDLVVEKSGTDAVIQWTLAPGATTSDVLRGSFAELPVGSGGGAESCIGNDLVVTTATDADVPPPHGGVWYLVRGANTCAGSGPYGFATTNGVPAAPRGSSVCP